MFVCLYFRSVQAGDHSKINALSDYQNNKCRSMETKSSKQPCFIMIASHYWAYIYDLYQEH